MQLSQTMRKNHAKQVRKLAQTNMSEDQAAAMVKVIGEQVHTAVSSAMVDVATKADIADMAAKADIADMATKADIANLNQRMDNLVTKQELHQVIGEAFDRRNFTGMCENIASLKTAMHLQMAVITIILSALLFTSLDVGRLGNLVRALF